MSAALPISPLSLADARGPLWQRQPPALPMSVNMVVHIWNVEHGACAMVYPTYNDVPGRVAMIDAGCRDDWHPSIHIRYAMNRTQLDYLFIQNADQDHLRDLGGLSDYGVNVLTLYRANVSSGALRLIKLAESGKVTQDFERFVGMHESYVAPVPHPFDTSMGGITFRAFHNTFPQFTNTNDLSLVLFFKFHNFKILFGGDMERAGWLALLENPAFRAELAYTDILVAPHHGRTNGFCREIFNYCAPTAVVMSDKQVKHGTQEMAATYRNVVHPTMNGVPVRGERRFVLTTRNDGHITFVVSQQSNYHALTHH